MTKMKNKEPEECFLCESPIPLGVLIIDKDGDRYCSRQCYKDMYPEPKEKEKKKCRTNQKESV